MSRSSIIAPTSSAGAESRCRGGGGGHGGQETEQHGAQRGHAEVGHRLDARVGDQDVVPADPPDRGTDGHAGAARRPTSSTRHGSGR